MPYMSANMANLLTKASSRDDGVAPMLDILKNLNHKKGGSQINTTSG